MEKATDWYVSLFGGAAIPEDTHISYAGGNYLVDFNTGFTVGAVLGTQLLPAMRGELELSYAQFDSDTATDGGVTTNAPGDVGAVFLLANLWQDFDIGRSVTPYGGFGLGMAFANVDIDILNNGGGIDDTTTALAAQLGAGITFDVTDRVTIDTGYRFKMVLDALTKGGAGNPHGMASYYTHVLQAGAGLKF
jgi:opacity protein-like surface antigen